MSSQYSILINTCDNFEDCWNPFFKLFSIYWPDFKGKIYLNTEYKDFSYPGLDISCTKVCELNNVPQNIRATWSQCLKWALEQVDTEVLLYMQEDYFLKDTVKNDIVEKYVSLMRESKEIDCIHLTDQAVIADSKSNYENLDKVVNKQKYRVSCQAALWKKSEMIDIVRVYENAWEFEEFGSMRSGISQGNYYVVNSSFVQLNRFEIIPYIFTGIVQGRWKEETVSLFEKHNIYIDFTKRGFLKNTPTKSLIKRIKYWLNKIPKILRNKIELKSIERHIKHE